MFRKLYEFCLNKTIYEDGITGNNYMLDKLSCIQTAQNHIPYIYRWGQAYPGMCIYPKVIHIKKACFYTKKKLCTELSTLSTGNNHHCRMCTSCQARIFVL